MKKSNLVSKVEVCRGWEIWDMENEDGRYRSLRNEDGIEYMRDSEDIVKDYQEFKMEAFGDVLIAGLGLGVCIDLLLSSSNLVRSIKVIEKDQDLVDFIGVKYNDLYSGFVEVVCADIFDYDFSKDIKFNSVFFDVWLQIGGNNWLEMMYLFDKVGDVDWVGGWREKEMRSKYFENFKLIR